MLQDFVVFNLQCKLIVQDQTALIFVRTFALGKQVLLGCRRWGCGARGVSSAKWGLTGRVHAFCGAVSRAADRTHRSRRPRESRRRNLQ